MIPGIVASQIGVSTPVVEVELLAETGDVLITEDSVTIIIE